MKKTLLFASLLAFAVSTQCIAAEATTTPSETPTVKAPVEKQAPANVQKPPRKMNPEMAKKKAEFEKRLNLTDEQKAKAKEIRQKGHDQMEPIMEQIKAKHQEIKTIRMSRMAVEMQQEKINEIRSELRKLNKQAHDLRMQNMKEFESILTAKQQKELKKMKEEGRKNFEKNFKKQQKCNCDCHKRPPFPPQDLGPRPPMGPDGQPPQEVPPQAPAEAAE